MKYSKSKRKHPNNQHISIYYGEDFVTRRSPVQVWLAALKRLIFNSLNISLFSSLQIVSCY
nr:MAG TPA: hypothetical protein [Caudoviricetes sp.]